MCEVQEIEIIAGDCLEVLDRLHAERGAFVDFIFCDPPYFLSNGGISCKNGKMVSVNKGEWDKSKGINLNHEFTLEWIERCRNILKPDGTIAVSGTLHIIYSIGFAMQQLDMKLLNNITWEKPNPPPNLACRYLTHSTETIIWASKSIGSKHTFNYKAMKKMNGGKQMKDVWRITAPGKAEKSCGKHPTQKPLELLKRLILSASNEGDIVLDAFNGSGTTGIACLDLGRKYIGIEIDKKYVALTHKRIEEKLSEMRNATINKHGDALPMF